MNIKFVKENDIEDLLCIYGQYINTSITFEYDLPSLDEFRNRVKNIQLNYPYIVFEENEKILGYAYAHEFNSRAAYQWGAELSVYVEKNYQRKNIGETLYYVLIDILKLQNVKTVYGCITKGNIPSENFHIKLGFDKVADFPKAGFKNNIWYDVVWYEKKLSDFEVETESFIPITKLERNLLQHILTRNKVTTLW